MKKFKWMIALIVVLLLTTMFSMTAFATNTGNVAGAVEGTWKAASSQIKTVVNNVVFPAIDLVLAVLFFVKVATAYMDYRKHGQIEWLRLPFCLQVWYLVCSRRCMCGRLLESKKQNKILFEIGYRRKMNGMLGNHGI